MKKLLINANFIITNGNILKKSHKLFYSNKKINLNKYKDYLGNIISTNTINNPPYITITNTYNIDNYAIIYKLNSNTTKLEKIENAKKIITKDAYDIIKKLPQFNCNELDYEKFICNDKLVLEAMIHLSYISKIN